MLYTRPFLFRISSSSSFLSVDLSLRKSLTGLLIFHELGLRFQCIKVLLRFSFLPDLGHVRLDLCLGRFCLLHLGLLLINVYHCYRCLRFEITCHGNRAQVIRNLFFRARSVVLLRLLFLGVISTCSASRIVLVRVLLRLYQCLALPQLLLMITENGQTAQD